MWFLKIYIQLIWLVCELSVEQQVLIIDKYKKNLTV